MQLHSVQQTRHDFANLETMLLWRKSYFLEHLPVGTTSQWLVPTLPSLVIHNKCHKEAESISTAVKCRTTYGLRHCDGTRRLFHPPDLQSLGNIDWLRIQDQILGYGTHSCWIASYSIHKRWALGVRYSNQVRMEANPMQRPRSSLSLGHSKTVSGTPGSVRSRREDQNDVGTSTPCLSWALDGWQRSRWLFSTLAIYSSFWRACTTFQELSWDRNAESE